MSIISQVPLRTPGQERVGQYEGYRTVSILRNLRNDTVVGLEASPELCSWT